MPTFLLKTEPGDYSFADLVRDGRVAWTGVSNNAALIHLRAIRKGDHVLIYHTGTEKAIVGLAVATSDPHEDPSRPGKTDAGAPKFAVVDLKPVKPAKTPVTLAQLKGDPQFAAFPLVTIGRLSVMPVAPGLDKALRQLAGL